MFYVLTISRPKLARNTQMMKLISALADQ